MPLPATVAIFPEAATFRTTLLLISEIYRFPDASVAMPYGEPICALVAAPPSPVWPQQLPLPAIVVMFPEPSTFRTREFPVSRMYRLPDGSNATPCGPFNWALMAGPLSPENPVPPVPATVEMVPLAVTFRTRLLFV